MRKTLVTMAGCLLLLASCAPKDGIRTIRATTDTEADLGRIKEIDGPVTVRLNGGDGLLYDQVCMRA